MQVAWPGASAPDSSSAVVAAVVTVVLVGVVVISLASVPPGHPQNAEQSFATAGEVVQTDLSRVGHNVWSARPSHIVLQAGHASAEYMPAPRLHSRWHTEENVSPDHVRWPESEFFTSQTDVAAVQSQSSPATCTPQKTRARRTNACTHRQQNKWSEGF